MFGFSRGAFTAKFLARMIHTVGLLCKGNEEMVPFAYRLYQRYLRGEVREYKRTHPKHGRKKDGEANGDDADAPADGDAEPPHIWNRRKRLGMEKDEITAFSDTFCRKEEYQCCGRVEERNIKVYFLGIWDCVNSVSVLEPRTPIPVPIKGTAHYVRHAVGVDERRVKFKPALLAQDIRRSAVHGEDIKEVWFPGCHGDVGGGWPAAAVDEEGHTVGLSLWQRIKNFWTTNKAKQPTRDALTEPFQMSDIPLSWMIREVELVGKKDTSAALKWRSSVQGFKERLKKRKDQALTAIMHDSLVFNNGTGFFSVLLWRFMGKKQPPRSWLNGPFPVADDETEWFPFITRWELEHNEWVNVRFPLNGGATRDIPPDAVIHQSLLWRLKNDESYEPKNNHGDQFVPCLKHEGRVAEVEPVQEKEDERDEEHLTYKFTSKHKREKSFSW